MRITCIHVYIHAWLRAHTHTSPHIHSLATLLGTPCKYWIGPPFAFWTASIIRGIDSTRFCKHSSEILVHVDMIASRSCCRFVGCTSMMRISRSTTSQRCSILLLNWDLVTVEAVWVKWTHCHVQETSLRWFELCDTVWSSATVAHLLQGSTCCVFRDDILYSLVVTSGYLSYCCLSIISNQSAHSPLTSTRHFRPHNCRSLDIFSFSDHSL